MSMLAKYQAKLSKQVSAATILLTVQVAQTSQTVQQIGTIASHALETAQQVKARTKQLKHEVTNILCAYIQQMEVSTQQQLSTATEALVRKIAQASLTVEETMQQEQLQEITKLRAELAMLKSEIVKGSSTIHTTDVTGQAELKGVISNLEVQLDLEHTTRETDKHWYKGVIDEMAQKQQESALQCALIKQRLSKKDAQVQELLKIVSEMSDSMGQLKEQIAQVKQGTAQSLQSGPTLVGRIPDARSAAIVPRLPSGCVRIRRNVAHMNSEPANAPNTQFVNVEAPMYDTTFVYHASSPMRGYTIEAIVMQGASGHTLSDPQAVAQATFGSTLQGQAQLSYHLELLFQCIRM